MSALGRRFSKSLMFAHVGTIRLRAKGCPRSCATPVCPCSGPKYRSATPRYAVRDLATMLRRNLLHARRYPALTFAAVFSPVVFPLTFVYVFGGTMGAILDVGGGSTGHRSGAAAGYLGYVTPGIRVLTISQLADVGGVTVRVVRSQRPEKASGDAVSSVSTWASGTPCGQRRDLEQGR